MVTLNPYLGVTKEEGYRKRASNAYNKKYQRFYHLNINKKTEKELIEWLEKNKPYQRAIKQLIRQQIELEKKK